MNIEQIQKILDKHELWLEDKEGGGRADLRRANLKGANLGGANLGGANLEGATLKVGTGNMKQLKSIFLETYPITYTETTLQIGCERHQIAAWKGFDEERILSMGGKSALVFWRKYKDLIFQCIDVSPALPTGYIDKG